MNTAARRSAWLKLRVTPEEKEAITAKATRSHFIILEKI